jgi:hypothetical protein
MDDLYGQRLADVASAFMNWLGRELVGGLVGGWVVVRLAGMVAQSHRISWSVSAVNSEQ